MSRSVSTNINETQRSVYALSPPYSDSRNIFNQSPLVSSQSRFAINYPFQFSASDFCFSSPVSSLSRKENLGIVDSYLKSFNFRAMLRFFIFWVTLESLAVWSWEIIMAGGANFVQRVLSYVVNEVVINGLANRYVVHSLF